MNQINIQSELLNRIMELAKELKITPFAEKLNNVPNTHIFMYKITFFKSVFTYFYSPF